MKLNSVGDLPTQEESRDQGLKGSAFPLPSFTNKRAESILDSSPGWSERMKRRERQREKREPSSVLNQHRC